VIRGAAGWRTLARRACVASGLCLLACLPGEPTRPQNPDVVLVVRAQVSATSVALVVVQVTAPDITTPLGFNIPVTNGLALGSVTLPAGSNRTITMRAYDASGVETHRGAKIVDVHEGTNPTVQLTLTPVSGQIPIEVELGSVTVTIVPAADTVAVADSTVLKARVLDGLSNPVAGPVIWATLAPGVALARRTSDSTSTVTAKGTGTTQIVAAFAGVAATATIVVP
jgi:hypothetical protein